ncbi:response regulator transcription factor [Chloroflexota bacterium]
MQNETGKAHKILVIEDAEDMLQLLQRILTNEGFQVRLAADGVYGITILREESPDLVLLDIMMPGPDGLTVLDRIREYSNIPVIMLTGKHDAETIKKSIDLGADDFVRKPFRPTELVARINTKLRRL